MFAEQKVEDALRELEAHALIGDGSNMDKLYEASKTQPVKRINRAYKKMNELQVFSVVVLN